MNDLCPACLGDSSRPYSKDEWQIDGEIYRLAQCLTCESVRTVPMPSDATLKKLYGASFDYRWYQDHYDAKLRDSRDRVHEYRPLLGSHVLDYGGGLGYFSKAAIEMGLESITFDPYVGDRQPIAGKWDAVVGLHMLEHSNNLDQTVSDIKSFLVTRGRVILAVPNFEGEGYSQLGMRWVWAQPPLVHIFHLTARGVSTLLLRHGFKNIQISYCERWDANNWCDVIHVVWFKKWDSIWGVQPLNRFPVFRRLIACINFWQRNHGLQRALRGYNSSDKRYSELQVVAELA